MNDFLILQLFENDRTMVTFHISQSIARNSLGTPSIRPRYVKQISDFVSELIKFSTRQQGWKLNQIEACACAETQIQKKNIYKKT